MLKKQNQESENSLPSAIPDDELKEIAGGNLSGATGAGEEEYTIEGYLLNQTCPCCGNDCWMYSRGNRHLAPYYFNCLVCYTIYKGKLYTVKMPEREYPKSFVTIKKSW